MTPVQGHMRTVSPAIAGSVIVHAAALGIVGWWSLTHRDDRLVVAPDLDVTLIDAVPIEVVAAPRAAATQGDTAAAVLATTPTAPVANHRGTSHQTIGTTAGGTTTTGSEVGTRHDTTGGRAHDYMKMRGANLALSPEFFAKLGPGEAHLPPPSSGWLDSKPGGRFHIDDEVASIDVRKDGTVKITDKPDVDIHWALPIPSLHDLGDMIQAWREDPYAATRVGPTQDLPAHELAVPDTWNSGTNGNPDGNPTPRFHGEGGGGSVIPILGGNLDLTAWAMRKFGVGDAYSARKHKLLADTIDERAYHGGAYRTEQLDRSAEIMRKNLDTLWQSTMDPAARREALFELWDECAEGEGALGEAGDRARSQVIGWIAARLPKGSPGAFTDDDIARLDAKRTSKAHFVPYEVKS